MSLPLIHSQADIIQGLLVGLALGTEPSANGSWPVYTKSQPDTPDNVITTYNTVGVIDGRSNIDGEVFEHYGFMVRVRANRGDVAYVKASAIAEALAKQCLNSTVSLDGNTYVVCAACRKGGINDLGKEYPSGERNVFTINYTAAIYRTV